MSPDRKRPRTDDYSFTETRSIAADVRSRRSAFLQSLGRGVSPPAGRESPSLSNGADPQPPLRSILETKTTTTFVMNEDSNFKNARISSPRIVPSPFKLTRIRDLPAIANVDTISIREILGDVMLKEVWLFDFLYDVDWMM